jgi:hypothetical protein
MLVRVTKIVMLLTFATAMNVVTAAAQEPTPLERFLDQYRCPVIDRLERIYAAGDPDKHRDEYLIIDIPTRSETYVQCIFHPPRNVYCEAASGYFSTRRVSREQGIYQLAQSTRLDASDFLPTTRREISILISMLPNRLTSKQSPISC